MTWATANMVCHRTCSLQIQLKKYEMGKNEERDTGKPGRMCSLFFSSGQQGDSNPLQSSGRCLLLMWLVSMEQPLLTTVYVSKEEECTNCALVGVTFTSVSFCMLFQGRDSVLPIPHPSWALAQHCTWICTYSSYSTTATTAELVHSYLGLPNAVLFKWQRNKIHLKKTLESIIHS